MYEHAKNFIAERPRTRKVFGVLFIIAGFLALITPLTPGAILLTVLGLELLGFELLLIEKFKTRFGHETKLSDH